MMWEKLYRFGTKDQNEGCENKQFELHNSDDSKDV